MDEMLRKTRIRAWLALVGTATLLLGAAYAFTQQSTRLSADDLPLRTAETVKQELESKAEPTDVVSPIKTDLKNSTNTFVIVTDNSYHVRASSATLNGKTPLPPKSVFELAKEHSDDRFTWKPAKDVRLATIVTAYGSGADSGFIVTGQSLKQVEDRINTFTALAFGAWLTILIWTSVVLLMPVTKPSKK